MVSNLVPVLASVILISTPLSPLSLQPAPIASSPFVFTRVMPENNFVVHMAEEGETLKIIADHYYGNSEYWTNIWNDNLDISNPDEISAGFMVKLQISVPEKTEELEDQLEEKLSKLYPRPVFVAAVNNYPQSSYEEVYKTAGEKYGIPWQILYGLHYTETGCRNGEIYNGQGSGAQGPMQFMPGTWRAYGVDGDGDGVADINQAVDAIHGAANYLAKHGTLENGLRAYGGNTPGTLAAARAKGYSL